MLFSQPIELTLENCTVDSIIEKEWMHPSTLKLKIICTYESTEFAEQFKSIFSQSPVHLKGRPSFTDKKIRFKTPFLYDTVMSHPKGYSSSPVCESIKQAHLPLLKRGAIVNVQFSVLGTYSKGLLFKLNTIHDEQNRTLLTTNGVGYY